MFRLTFRFLGLLLLAAAFAALVIDGTRSIAGGALSLSALGQTLSWLMPDKFSRVHSADLPMMRGSPDCVPLAIPCRPLDWAANEVERASF